MSSRSNVANVTQMSQLTAQGTTVLEMAKFPRGELLKVEKHGIRHGIRKNAVNLLFASIFSIGTASALILLGNVAKLPYVKSVISGYGRRLFSRSEGIT